ncbi:ArsR/SmtB family transcription factor [Erwinia sp. BNK-24-b]|uniref:ArsR/SmtB family transcription factor n=1 Tax=unclassified Erwinia TaxID=2622719 RepID=UPI0039BFED89
MMKHHPNREQLRLDSILAALGHPVRMSVVKVLADGKEHTCGSLLKGISKSTLTHHWRTLRDGGIIWQIPSGRENLLSLRREDLDSRFPGLLDSFLKAATQDEQTSSIIATYCAE